MSVCLSSPLSCRSRLLWTLCWRLMISFLLLAASESTNQRVIQWSFFQAAALVAVSLLQIFYIKKLFETTRTV